jgi:hypothetical protein
MLEHRRPASIDVEFQTLVRRHAGLVHKVRLEALGERLAGGKSVIVHQCHPGFCGDRVTMLLDHDRLTMSLLRPERRAVCSLACLRWKDGVGWIVVANNAAGERIVFYAWKAALTPLRS